MIRRIIGLPGETVSTSRPEGLLINNDGVHFPEEISTIYQSVGKTNADWAPALLEGSSTTLGHDEFFVLADSHANSVDSRLFGPVKISEIVGKVEGVKPPPPAKSPPQ